MPKLITGTHPTRMDLLKVKKRAELATKGHKLLSEKLTTLIVEFFKVMDKAKGIRGELAAILAKGRKNLAKAKALSSFNEVESIAASIEAIQELKLDMYNLMGVKIPRIEFKPEGIKEYNPLFTSAKLDEAVRDFNEVLTKVIALVENEEALRRVGEEVKKIKRRTNALEYILIPNLNYTKRYIQLRLEELERESFFGLKIIKRKRE